MIMEQKEIIEDIPSSEDEVLERLHFKPKKDIPLFILAILSIVVIILISVFSKPKSSDLHVEIRYQNHLLWDKNDESKSTAISFPKEGSKRVTFDKEDSSLFFTDGTTFLFDYPITFTLYSDYSIELLEEDVECPDHICSHMGRIYQTYVPIVCLPNQIQAMIVASSFPETIN